MPKVYNKRDKDYPKDAIYVGRPTKWGNPYRVGIHGTRSEVVRRYRESLAESDKQDIRSRLKGKDLVCWCAPEACHADVLLEIAND
jgi:hypothetical protein